MRIKVGACYEMPRNCCDIRVLKREDVDGGYVRYQVEKISGRNKGVKRWEYSDYLKFTVLREIDPPRKR